MTEQDRPSCFVLLRAFDRMAAVLRQHKLAPPAPVPQFLDLAWTALGDDSPALPPAGAMEAVFDAHIVDEQDAGTEEILLNLYLYALADFCLYCESAEASSLDAALSAVLDFHDFIASQRYLAEHKGGQAAVLTAADEDAIRNDPGFAAERRAQDADRQRAQDLGALQLTAQLR